MQKWINHCNLKNPGEFSDIATVEEKALLPIQSVSYGPINSEGISASVVVNELTCYPKEQPEWSMKDQVKENVAKIDIVKDDVDK